MYIKKGVGFKSNPLDNTSRWRDGNILNQKDVQKYKNKSFLKAAEWVRVE